MPAPKKTARLWQKGIAKSVRTRFPRYARLIKTINRLNYYAGKFNAVPTPVGRRFLETSENQREWHRQSPGTLRVPGLGRALQLIRRSETQPHFRWAPAKTKAVQNALENIRHARLQAQRQWKVVQHDLKWLMENKRFFAWKQNEFRELEHLGTIILMQLREMDLDAGETEKRLEEGLKGFGN